MTHPCLFFEFSLEFWSLHFFSVCFWLSWSWSHRAACWWRPNIIWRKVVSGSKSDLALSRVPSTILTDTQCFQPSTQKVFYVLKVKCCVLHLWQMRKFQLNDVIKRKVTVIPLTEQVITERSIVLAGPHLHILFLFQLPSSTSTLQSFRSLFHVWFNEL